MGHREGAVARPLFQATGQALVSSVTQEARACARPTKHVWGSLELSDSIAFFWALTALPPFPLEVPSRLCCSLATCAMSGFLTLILFIDGTAVAVHSSHCLLRITQVMCPSHRDLVRWASWTLS